MKPGQFNKATPKFMGFKFELQRTSIANHLSIQKKNPVLAPLTTETFDCAIRFPTDGSTTTAEYRLQYM